MSPPLLLLHAYGSPEAGGPWRDALSRGPWSGPWSAPDLPGHGAAPAWLGGSHDASDLALMAVNALADAGWTDADADGLGRPVVGGVEASAHGAELLAAAGRTWGIVVVDGLGGQRCDDPDTLIDVEYAWLRSVADHPSAAGPPPAGPDPLVALGYSPRLDERFSARLRTAIRVPVLVVETPGSPTPPGDLEARLDTFGGPVSLVQAADRDPGTVVPLMTAWLRDAAAV